MHGSPISVCVAVLEPVLCLIALLYVLGRRTGTEYRYFSALLGCHLCSSTILVFPYLFGGHGIDYRLAYKAYFWIYWVSFIVETVFSLLAIYDIFDLAMAPLEGIRKLGRIVFRWAFCMSVAVISGSVLLPHLSGRAIIVDVVKELQRTESILTLCLLLFVCFAIQPLGLTYKSRVFGISLGLGILAMTKLIAFNLMTKDAQLYAHSALFDNISTCAALILWIGYFVLPEAERRIVVLPTTSPFLRWNQISQALGHSPGFVAVGGISPTLFAPAELEMLRRASLRMVDQPGKPLAQPQTA